MYKAEFIQKLKQTNVSVDGEKTKERAENLWKSANNEIKRQIEEDSGCSRASIYRIYHTGAISAKMAVAFAQKLNSDPYYLTGETDVDNGYNEEQTERFLREKGYSNLLNEYAEITVPKVRTRRKRSDAEIKTEETPEIVSSEEKTAGDAEPAYAEGEVTIVGEVNAVPSITEEEPEKPMASKAENDTVLTDITEDEMIALLHSLVIRARLNKDARNQLDKVKLLLSF